LKRDGMERVSRIVVPALVSIPESSSVSRDADDATKVRSGVKTPIVHVICDTSHR
jgi:hypothetical protein